MISDTGIVSWLEDIAARGGYRGAGLVDITASAGGSCVEVSVETWNDDAALFAAALVEELGEDGHDAFYTHRDEEPDEATIIIACDRAPWEVES